MDHFPSTLQRDFGIQGWEVAEGLREGRYCTGGWIDEAKGIKAQNLVDVAL